MTCNTCHFTSASRIKVINGIDYCNNCTSMTVTGGSKVDGAITRNSQRIREQQKQFAADFIPPYTYDKAKHKGVVNKEFVNAYPEQAAKTFTSQELQSVGVIKIKGKA